MQISKILVYLGNKTYKYMTLKSIDELSEDQIRAIAIRIIQTPLIKNTWISNTCDVHQTHLWRLSKGAFRMRPATASKIVSTVLNTASLVRYDVSLNSRSNNARLSFTTGFLNLSYFSRITGIPYYNLDRWVRGNRELSGSEEAQVRMSLSYAFSTIFFISKQKTSQHENEQKI